MPDTPHRIRVLHMADSHLGFDLPVRPRVKRRRRGHDFQENHDRALAAALGAGVDLVVHGGDLFHRPGAIPSLAYQAFRGLLEVAESGIPVFLVPGNHERARIPHPHLAAHPNLHIFHGPGTVSVRARGARVVVGGFPYERRRVRDAFPEILGRTGLLNAEADLRLLCMHHCVEGATVGPADYTFRNAPDVVRGSDLPRACGAVLSGHIHRAQLLTRDLSGRPLPAPVAYPGSVERTAFAEAGEEKGFLILDFQPGPEGGRLIRHEFVRLPARPMVVLDLRLREGAGANRSGDPVWAGGSGEAAGRPSGEWTRSLLRRRLAAVVPRVPENAVLRLRIHGRVPPEARPELSAATLRALAPSSMNLEAQVMEDRGRGRGAFRRH